MPDNLTTKQRSYTMSRIRSRGNLTTEKRLEKILRGYKIFGWRRHADLPGRPDFVFWKHKVAVFVDGCFWHGCPTCSLEPKSNIEYWTKKIENNRRRDKRVRAQLNRKGWSTIRIWEHSLNKSDLIGKRVRLALEKSLSKKQFAKSRS